MFSEPVKGISTATVRLVNVRYGWVVRAKVRYDAARRTLVIDPVYRMYGSALYRVEIRSGITDRAGNLLIAMTWTFRTRR